MIPVSEQKLLKQRENGWFGTRMNGSILFSLFRVFKIVNCILRKQINNWRNKEKEKQIGPTLPSGSVLLKGFFYFSCPLSPVQPSSQHLWPWTYWTHPSTHLLPCQTLNFCSCSSRHLCPSHDRAHCTTDSLMEWVTPPSSTWLRGEKYNLSCALFTITAFMESGAPRGKCWKRDGCCIGSCPTPRSSQRCQTTELVLRAFTSTRIHLEHSVQVVTPSIHRKQSYHTRRKSKAPLTWGHIAKNPAASILSQRHCLL